MVSTRTDTGSIGVLANHAPLMGILEPTELRLYKSESEVEKFAQGEGYLQVVDNHALVLVEEAIRPDQLDKGDIESRMRDAEQAMQGAAQRRLAVRPGRHDAERATANLHAVAEELRDRVAALVLQGQWRHREQRVVGEQRDDVVDGAGLNRV